MEGNERTLHEILTELRELKSIVVGQLQQSEYVTPAEAAQKLGRAVWTVQQYLRTGALRGERSGARSGPFGRWVIHVDELDRFKLRRPQSRR